MNCQDRKVKAHFLKKAKKFVLGDIRWRKQALDCTASAIKDADSLSKLFRSLREECEFFDNDYEVRIIKHLAEFF